MRGDALLRTLALLRLLQARRIRLAQLAATLSVTTRTVRRDLEILSVAGFPVRHDRDDYGDTGLWWIAGDGCPVCARRPA